MKKLAILLILAATSTACSIAPVRDALHYTENKCMNMGFIKGTREHSECQLLLELQYSRKSSVIVRDR
jgi:hypothetical protein